jgi:hypothetical protein
LKFMHFWFAKHMAVIYVYGVQESDLNWFSKCKLALTYIRL